jgi:hypothetical protein
LSDATTAVARLTHRVGSRLVCLGLLGLLGIYGPGAPGNAGKIDHPYGGLAHGGHGLPRWLACTGCDLAPPVRSAACLLHRRAAPARYRPAVWLSGDLVALSGLPGACPRARWRGPPLCGQPPLGRPQRPPQAPPPAVPATPVVAAARALRRAPGRRLRPRVAGVLLCLPWLARVRCAHLVRHASAPGSTLVPAPRALWRLLVLKLLDKARRSHSNDLHGDAAVGGLAGLHGPPKTSAATAAASRTRRAHQHKGLSGWIGARAPVLCPHATPCSLDFPPIPCRGDATGLDQHSRPRRGNAGPRVVRVRAHAHESRVFGEAKAPLARRAQAGAALQFVALWQERPGVHPQWRSCDAQVVPSPELAPLHHRGIWWGTIRRRGAAIRRRRSALPASPWRQAVLATAHRRQHRLRDLEETVHLPGDTGARRPRAVTGLGRAPPPLCLATNAKARARALMVRDASRNRVEDGLGSSVHVFHLDGVASEVRLPGDLDTTRTVRANGCYRWRAKQLRGFDTAAPKQLSRQCVAPAGVGDSQPERIGVHVDKRCHNPSLREAALDQPRQAMPWWRHLPVVFPYP